MFAAKALKSYDSCKWFTGNLRNNQGKICLAQARSAWPMQEPAIWIRCWKSRILDTTTYVPWHTCSDLVPLSILSYWG